MNIEYRKLLKFIGIGAVLLFLLDFTIGSILDRLYNKMRNGERGRGNYVITEAKPDVLILGSSRALYHYHSGVISDSLKLSVFNAGRSNQTILYHLPVLKSVIARHKPKIVVLDLNEQELTGGPLKYELLRALTPYYHRDKEIKNYLDEINPQNKVLLLSRIMPYNSSIFAIIYRGVISKEKSLDINGFLGHGKIYKKKIETLDNCSENKIDEGMKKRLVELIAICKEQKIRLVLVVSPRFAIPKCKSKGLTEIERIASKTNTELYNFSALFTEPELFADPAHLNLAGATKYSSYFVKNILLKQAGDLH